MLWSMHRRIQLALLAARALLTCIQLAINTKPPDLFLQGSSPASHSLICMYKQLPHPRYCCAFRSKILFVAVVAIEGPNDGFT